MLQNLVILSPMIFNLKFLSTAIVTNLNESLLLLQSPQRFMMQMTNLQGEGSNAMNECLEQQRQKHLSDIAKLQQAHDEDVIKLKEEHHQEIERIRQQHKLQIDETKAKIWVIAINVCVACCSPLTTHAWLLTLHIPNSHIAFLTDAKSVGHLYILVTHHPLHCCHHLPSALHSHACFCLLKKTAN
jgi:hypothetical protein